MALVIPDRIQRAIEVGLGVYFAGASLSDLWPSIGFLRGFTPPGSPRTFQVIVGCLAAVGATGLFAPRLSRYGAWLLAALWLLRTVWDMTGGETVTVGWALLLPLLLLVRGRRGS